MKKATLSIFLFLIFLTNLLSQVQHAEVSFGILYADIKTVNVKWQEGNPWRRGVWITVNQKFTFKKWFTFDAGLTYQERIPLEVLTFGMGDPSSAIPGVSQRYIFGNFPTNPQNKLFNLFKGEYSRIPNFKYLDIEAIPTITWGESWKFSVGIGFFGGILLNKKSTTVSKEDLPAKLAVVFDAPPRFVSGEVLYHRYDYGWIPKISIAYKIREKITVGIQFKSYQSFARLNDTFVSSEQVWNMRWTVFAGGLSFQYRFGKIE